jgi:hypothetical protein
MPRLVRRGSSTEGRRRRLASCSARSSLPGTDTATSVRVRGGQRLLTDGPFLETKEHLGGFFLIEVPDLDTALDWAARMPHAAYGTAEVRAVRTGMAWQAALG